MANNNFYKYLEAAFRYKLKNTDALSFEYLGSNFPYETIFWYARNGNTALPSIYRQSPNTKDGNFQMVKKVIENLDKHLDPELNRYFNPVTGSIENTPTPETTQQPVTQVSGQPMNQPFSLTTPPTPVMSRPISPETATVTPTQAVPETEISQAPNPAQPQTQPTDSQPSFQVPRLPTSFVNTAKTLGSNTQIFAKKNLGRIGSGLTNMAKGIGRGMAGGISTGLGAAAPSLGRAFRGGLRGLNGIGRMTEPGGIGSGGLSKGLSKSSKKFAWVFLGLFFLMAIGAGLLGGLPSNTPTGEASPIGSGCPDTSTNRIESSCQYLNPSIDIFNTTLSKSAIDSYITKYSPIFINAGKGNLTEFTNRVNYIVNSSQRAGLNPAIFLGYWKSESNFSTIGSRDMGCLGNNFYEQVDCALGINTYSDPAKNPTANCAKSKDANSIACTSLKSIRQTFDQTHPINYPIATFDNFAEAYGPYDDLSGGLHTNCTHTYNDLLDVAKELSACNAQPAPSSDLAACPVAGNISTPYGYNIYGYIADASNEGCQGYNLCHNGVDIAASAGMPVKSVIDGVVQEAKFDPSMGNYIIIKSPSDLYITYEHLQDPSPLQPGTSVKKNDIVGKVGATGGAAGVHLHYKIKQGTALLNPLKYLKISNPDPILLTKSDNLVDNNYNGSPPQDPSHNKDNWGTCQ